MSGSLKALLLILAFAAVFVTGVSEGSRLTMAGAIEAGAIEAGAASYKLVNPKTGEVRFTWNVGGAR